MTTSNPVSTVSRRAALAGMGAGGLGAALVATASHAAAQDATPSPMAGHPMVGTWIVDNDINARPICRPWLPSRRMAL